MSSRQSSAGRFAATKQDWQGRDGWRCHQCAAFVPNGCAHHCPTTAITPAITPRRPQRQDSLTDQMGTVVVAAEREGCYDAADWLKRAFWPEVY